MARTGSKRNDPNAVARQDWETPVRIVSALSRLNGKPFTIDVCATKRNRKAPEWIDKRRNSFKTPWTGDWWCNPPYGKDLHLWLERGIDSLYRDDSNSGVFLVPGNNLERKVYHEQVLPCLDGIVIFKGRISFEYRGKTHSGNDINNVALFLSAGGVQLSKRFPSERPFTPWIYSMSAKVGL